MHIFYLLINYLLLRKRDLFHFFFLANRSFCLNKVRQIENAKLMRIFQVCILIIKKNGLFVIFIVNGLYFNIKNYNILNSNIKLYLIYKTTAS